MHQKVIFSIAPEGAIDEIRNLLQKADTAVRLGRRRKAIFFSIRAIALIVWDCLKKKGGFPDGSVGLV